MLDDGGLDVVQLYVVGLVVGLDVMLHCSATDGVAMVLVAHTHYARRRNAKNSAMQLSGRSVVWEEVSGVAVVKFQWV